MAYNPDNNPSQIIGARRKAIASSFATKTIADTAVSLADLSITLNDRCDWVEIQIETQSLRYRTDTGVPTASLGYLATAGIDPVLVLSRDEAQDLEMIRATATSSVINIQQFYSF